MRSTKARGLGERGHREEKRVDTISTSVSLCFICRLRQVLLFDFLVYKYIVGELTFAMIKKGREEEKRRHC